jgi:membrane protein implicated in regulation of membrane protease activity
MDWSHTTFWWIAAGALVALELATGTFYLLMLALGAGAGAIAAHLGLSGTAQVVCAAVVGVGATVAWHLRRAGQPKAAPAEANADVNLDIGQTLTVETWQADGTARAMYRGAPWSVRYASSGTPAPGAHVIVAVHGTQLRVSPAGASR